SLWMTRISARSLPLRRSDLVALLLLVGVAVWGERVVRVAARESAPSVPVAIVQASVPQDQKWSASSARSILDKHERLTQEAAQGKPALVLWPESSSPFPLATPSSTDPRGARPNREYREKLESLTHALGVTLLFGTVDYRREEGQVRPLNAAALVRPDGT